MTSAVILFVTIVATVAVMFYPAKWVTSIREVSLCLLAASWLLSCVIRRQRIRVDIALIPLCGIILWAVLQMVFGITVYPWRTWISILYWTANAAAFFVGLNTFGDKRVRGIFFRCLIWFGFAVSILATVQSLTPNGKIYWVFPTEYSGWNLMGP
ncbi:MAG TPA: hypothetical protein VHB50_03865, partial [Bryobacteraceae bacterium]|nr:hypothetical protein [Bryobacteraceae bacterium]